LLMAVLELAAIILVVTLGGYYIIKYKKEFQYFRFLNLHIVNSSEEMHKTLAVGLYHRFKQEPDEAGPIETSYRFEKFVAKVMVNYYGGTTTVTNNSDDYGIHIIHDREDGQYLGQVMCYDPDKLVPYDPIALIHSQMVKRGAKGGFVVTTSDFSPQAKKYSQDLNIEIINGRKLTEYWIKGLEAALNSERDEELEPGLI
jgi:restriction system protein